MPVSYTHLTPLKTKDFGRIAAQTAKHVIRQGIREAERSQQMCIRDRSNVRKGAAIVSMCIEGRQISSDELAQFLADRANSGAEMCIRDRTTDGLLFARKAGPGGAAWQKNRNMATRALLL